MLKRLAYLSGEYPRATDTFIQREVAGLRNADFQVETISVRRPSTREQGTDEQAKERAGTHYLIPCSPFRLLSDHFRLFFQNPIRYCQGVWLALSIRSPGLKSLLYQIFYFAEAGLVAAHMKQRGLTHIHNHAPDACGYVAMLASQIGGLTYSMTLHGFGIFAEPSRWRLKEKIERSLFTICISQHGRSQAMLWSDHKFWDKIHVVHCGVNSDHAQSRVHTGVGQNILFVGRLDYVKGLPVLIDAFSILNKQNNGTHLHIVGDGPAKSQLQQIVKEKGLDKRIIFYGYQSQTELKDQFDKADIFVMTSFVEGIPVVLMEAMSNGVPVIAPNITGIPELVQHDECGFLTTPADSKCLAERMEILLNDTEQRNRFAVNGLQKVKDKFNITIEIDKLTSIFKRYSEG